MVVVGEPGSGKTVLILHLILDLLENRKNHSDHLVPVRFNATGWDGTSSLSDFLLERLHAEYSLLMPVARALVESQRIVPIIDGLDEMDALGERPRHGIGAVECFNRPEWATYPLVVTCRREAYEKIQANRDGAGIASSTVLGLKPLPTTEIIKHVQNRIKDQGAGAGYARSLEAMVKRLEADPSGALGVTLQTPWMLTLALSYLRDVDPSDAVRLIQSESQEAITDQLFAAQIPAACAHQPGHSDEWRYSESDVQHWTRAFAEFVSQVDNGQRRTEVSLDQLWSLAGERRTLRTHQLAVGLTTGLAVGLAYAQVFGLMFGQAFGLAVGLAFGLAFGLGVGHAGGLAFGLLLGLADAPRGFVSPRPSRVYLRTHRKNELRTRMMAGVRAGVRVGLWFGLTAGVPTGVVAGVAAGVAAGVPNGVAYGLVAGLAVGVLYIPARFRTPQEANKVIHDDLVAGLSFGLVVGVSIGLGAGMGAAPSFGLAAGVACGVTVAVSAAAAAGRYGCAVVIFRRTGLFAPRPAQFLEWSARAGLLRITGTSYQLRHDTYRQWLITHPGPGSG
jgi:hypothetical protein